MTKSPRDTVDFGALDKCGAHVFRVEIPRTGLVRIVEDYGYEGGVGSVPYEVERALIPRNKWSKIREFARREFNERLRAKKMSTGRWKIGTTLMDRMLGRELCVLVWAAEHAELADLPIICTRWGALRPEERWWLFSVTASEAGTAGDSNRGWRRALFFALSDGGAVDRHLTSNEHVQITLPLY